MRDYIEALEQSNYVEREYSTEAYEDALKAWLSYVRKSPRRIDKIVIKDIHRRLMLRVDPEIAGKYRAINVTVGGRLCPSPADVPRLTEEWVQFHGMAQTKEDIVTGHVAFEKVHPFEDGNGRTGRFIMNLQLYMAGLPPIIVMAAKRPAPAPSTPQYDYYDWFI